VSSKIANKIWEITDYEIKEFKGNYDEWILWNERMNRNAAVEKHEAGKTTIPENINEIKPLQKNISINKELKKEIQKLQKQFSQTEEELNLCNEKITQLETDLADSTIYADKEKFIATEKN
jgi:ATP-binding cassette subfamily F protein 3